MCHEVEHTHPVKSQYNGLKIHTVIFQSIEGKAVLNILKERKKIPNRYGIPNNTEDDAVGL